MKRTALFGLTAIALGFMTEFRQPVQRVARHKAIREARSPTESARRIDAAQAKRARRCARNLQQEEVR